MRHGDRRSTEGPAEHREGAASGQDGGRGRGQPPGALRAGLPPRGAHLEAPADRPLDDGELLQVLHVAEQAVLTEIHSSGGGGRRRMHGSPGPLAARAGATPGCRTHAAPRAPGSWTFSRSRPREPGGRRAAGQQIEQERGRRGGGADTARGRGGRAGGLRGRGQGREVPPHPLQSRPLPGAARSRVGCNRLTTRRTWRPRPPLTVCIRSPPPSGPHPAARAQILPLSVTGGGQIGGV